jgi:hypothetical protein
MPLDSASMTLIARSMVAYIIVFCHSDGRSNNTAPFDDADDADCFDARARFDETVAWIVGSTPRAKGSPPR